MKRRIAVTGMGVVAPNGVGTDAYWDGLRSGRSGAGPITRFDATGLPTRIAAEITDSLPDNLPDAVGGIPVEGLPGRFALCSAMEALATSPVPADVPRERRALVVGGGCVDRLTDILGEAIIDGNPEAAGDPRGLDLDKVSDALTGIDGMDQYDAYAMIRVAPLLARLCDAGQVLTLSTACAGGGQALRDAARLIARGEADWALAGGVDALVTRQMMAGFCQLSAMSTRNDEPERASRPFDAERDGFVMGEGAAFLVLQPLDRALEQGVRIYAELSGAGISSDAYRLTDPRPDGYGMVLAMQRALSDAGLTPAEVSYINAHGTSTAANDSAETSAIKQVFQDRSHAPPVSSTKSMTGHLIHGAGAIEAVCCVLTLVHQTLPPTINLESPDPECDLDYVPNTAREARVEAVLSNSFGFGGQNTTLAFSRWAGTP